MALSGSRLTVKLKKKKTNFYTNMILNFCHETVDLYFC